MIIDNKGLVVHDRWREVSEACQLEESGEVLFSWQFFLDNKTAVHQRANKNCGAVGIILDVTNSLELQAVDLSMFSLIILKFEKFTDGRHFSFAQRVKRRFNFAGELRAAGNIYRDQLAYLRRVGFDSFDLEETCSEVDLADSLAGFSHVYQSSADEHRPIPFARRGDRLE